MVPARGRVPADVALVLAGVFVVLVVLNALTPLWGDDWWRVLAPHEWPQVFTRIGAEYLGWTGRVSTLLLTFVVLLDYPGSTLLFDVLNSAVFCVLLVIGVRAATGHWPGRRGAGVVLGGAFVGLWFLSHAFGEAVLWTTGAVAYLWVTTAAIAVLTPFVDLLADRRAAPDSRFRLWAAPLLGLFWAMTLENVAVSVALFMLYALLTAWRLRLPVRRWHWHLLAGQVLGVAVLVVAPGNYARAAAQGDGVPIWYRLGELAERIWRHGSGETYAFVVIGVLLLMQAALPRRTVPVRAGLWLVVGLMFAFTMIGSTGVNFAARTAFAADVCFVLVVIALAAPLLEHAGFWRSLPVLVLMGALWAADAMTTLEQYLAIGQQAQRREELMTAYRQAGLERIVLPSIEVPYVQGVHDDIVRGRLFLRDIHPPMKGNEWRNGTFAQYHGFEFATRLPQPYALYENELAGNAPFARVAVFERLDIYLRPEEKGFGTEVALYLVSDRRACLDARQLQGAAPTDVAWVDVLGRPSQERCVVRLVVPEAELTLRHPRLGRKVLRIIRGRDGSLRAEMVRG